MINIFKKVIQYRSLFMLNISLHDRYSRDLGESAKREERDRIELQEEGYNSLLGESAKWLRVKLSFQKQSQISVVFLHYGAMTGLIKLVPLTQTKKTAIRYKTKTSLCSCRDSRATALFSAAKTKYSRAKSLTAISNV